MFCFLVCAYKFFVGEVSFRELRRLLGVSDFVWHVVSTDTPANTFGISVFQADPSVGNPD